MQNPVSIGFGTAMLWQYKAFANKAWAFDINWIVMEETFLSKLFS